MFKFHHELAHLFVLHFHCAQVTLGGVSFTLTPDSISLATGMPNIGETNGILHTWSTGTNNLRIGKLR